MGDLPNDRWVRRAVATRLYPPTPPPAFQADPSDPSPPANPYGAWIASLRVARDALGEAITTDPNQYFPQMHAFFSAIEMLVACGDRTSAANELHAMHNHIGTFVRYLQSTDDDGHFVARDLQNSVDYYLATISGDQDRADAIAATLFRTFGPICHSIHGRADTQFGDEALARELSVLGTRTATSQMIDATFHDAYTHVLEGGQSPGPAQTRSPSIRRWMDVEEMRDAGLGNQSAPPPMTEE